MEKIGYFRALEKAYNEEYLTLLIEWISKCSSKKNYKFFLIINRKGNFIVKKYPFNKEFDDSLPWIQLPREKNPDIIGDIILEKLKSIPENFWWN